jgi:hypothetical protein
VDSCFGGSDEAKPLAHKLHARKRAGKIAQKHSERLPKGAAMLDVQGSVYCKSTYNNAREMIDKIQSFKKWLLL